MNVIGVFKNIREIFDKLNPFVHKYDILTHSQNGFRGGRSMETASQSFI